MHEVSLLYLPFKILEELQVKGIVGSGFWEAPKANCFFHRIGHELFRRYKAYKHSDDRLTELVLRTERSWLKTTTQLELLERIKDDLDPRLVDSFDASLTRLEIKLRFARSEIETLTDSDSSKMTLDRITLSMTKSKKARYSVFEEHIRRTVSELAQWQSEFDPSWLFLIRSTSEKIDTALAQQLQSPVKTPILDDIKAIRAILRDIEEYQEGEAPVFQDESFISPRRTSLPDSSLEATTTANSARNILLDTTTYPSQVDADDVMGQVRDLARILMHGEPSTLGLLRSLGVHKINVNAAAAQQYQFIYVVPPNMDQPATLRHLLLEASPSLDAKFCLARAMARGVASVHAAGFVHKNIRPETVLTLHEKGDSLPTAFLVGFERFRAAKTVTTLTGDMIWHRNLYRHPMRQGRHPDEMYQMQHDIYSLGVCLLELGLWHSFVLQHDPPRTGPLLEISTELTLKNKRQTALNIKKKLVLLATQELPQLMGLVYTEVVVSCLTCLDSDATNMFANDNTLRDQDGILVGVAFIDKIFKRLISIHISD